MRNSDVKNQSINNYHSDNNYSENSCIEESFYSTTENSPQITTAQAFNQSLIKLLVLLYQIDGKVTLTEQDYFEEVTAKLDWRSGVSISAFINDAIHQARVAIDQNAVRKFLFTLGNGLCHDAAQALKYAMEITELDRRRSEEQLEILALLSNRVLARGFVD